MALNTLALDEGCCRELKFLAFRIKAHLLGNLNLIMFRTIPRLITRHCLKMQN